LRSWLTALALIGAIGIAAAGDLKDVKIVFCRQVEDRAPVDPAMKFPADVGWVYCHTSVRNVGEATEIHHDWHYQGARVGRFTLPVGESQNWRTYSAKAISSAWVGKWRVVVKDLNEKELAHASFEIVPAGE
jgi:hypothetical protein